MPNHVTTRATIIGNIENFEDFAFSYEDDKVVFDFDKIIPMPECIKGSDSDNLSADVLTIVLRGTGLHTVWEQLRRWDNNDEMGTWKGLVSYEEGEIEERLEKAFPGCLEKARKVARCYGETGFKSWYEWSVANWGTKWGAYDFEILNRSEGSLQIRFQTAWTFPHPVFQKIAATFPRLTVLWEAHDEGSDDTVMVGKIIEGQCDVEIARDAELVEKIYAKDSAEA